MKHFLAHLSSYQVFLASRSPRRQQLLKDLGIPFTVWDNKDIGEEYPGDLTPEEVAVYLADKKAVPYYQQLNDHSILITADTIVSQGNQMMGKPVDQKEAMDMLSRLSGTAHEVVTGIGLTSASQSVRFFVSTKVWFAELSTDEIRYYVKKYAPMDKAGSYGIQEWIGLVGVTAIEGSYFNVMGLPVHRLYTELKKFTNY